MSTFNFNGSVTASHIGPAMVQPEVVLFKKLHDDAVIPRRGTSQSAGFDLYALEDTVIIGGCGNTIVPTGIAVQLPEGTYGRIAMRSGLAVNEHLSVSAGVIDLDYENKPLGVVVYCTKVFSVTRDTAVGNVIVQSPHEYIIKKGERFAQLILEKASSAKGLEVTEMIPRFGNHSGYGSTGKQ